MLLKLSISRATCSKAPAAAKSHRSTANWKKKMQWGHRGKALPSLGTGGGHWMPRTGHIFKWEKPGEREGRSSDKERLFNYY